MIPHILFIISLLSCFCSAVPASAQETAAVPDVDSLTHFTDIPSQSTRIKMTWDAPGGDVRGYYVLFGNTPGSGGWNTADAAYITGTSFISLDFADSDPRPDDAAWYFHIAAAYGEDMIGPVTTAGTYRIDVVPPSEVSVTGPEITRARTVTLFPEAEGASEMYISNHGYDEGGQWEPLIAFREWEVSEGTGDKRIYVRFRDFARNTADAYTDLRLVPEGDINADGAADLGDVILALKILTGAGTGDAHIYPDPGGDHDGRIGIADAVFILSRAAENRGGRHRGYSGEPRDR